MWCSCVLVHALVLLVVVVWAGFWLLALLMVVVVGAGIALGLGALVVRRIAGWGGFCGVFLYSSGLCGLMRHSVLFFRWVLDLVCFLVVALVVAWLLIFWWVFTILGFGFCYRFLHFVGLWWRGVFGLGWC